MDLILPAVASFALAGWGSFCLAMSKKELYRCAWLNQQIQEDDLRDALSAAEKQCDLLKSATAIAGAEVRAAMRSNEALAAKCADLTKQLVAEQEHYADLKKEHSDAIDLSAARYNQLYQAGLV